MRAIRAASAAVACGALVAACTAPASQEVPALLIDPSAQTRAELARAVSSEFGAAPVALADEALTVSPELVIERSWPRDAAGRLMNGRETGRPEIFRLVRAAGGQCVLVHDRNGRRIVLVTARCGR